MKLVETRGPASSYSGLLAFRIKPGGFIPLTRLWLHSESVPGIPKLGPSRILNNLGDLICILTQFRDLTQFNQLSDIAGIQGSRFKMPGENLARAS